MGKTPEEEYKEALKAQLTKEQTPEEPVFYSRTGFRHSEPVSRKPPRYSLFRTRRRMGLGMLLPLLLIFMMSGNLRGVVIPLMAAILLYLVVTRKR